MTDTILAERL